MSQQYRNKSNGTLITAVQFIGNFTEIERFVGGDAEWRGNRFVIAGPDGALRGGAYDWIIRDTKSGAFYTLVNSEFNTAFEKVTVT